MKNNITGVAAIALIVGLVVGYGASMIKGDEYQEHKAQSGMHMMPDGTMMANNENTNTAPSMGMADMMTSMNAELVGKTGDTFDQAFLSEMIVHHQGAVEMAQLALKNAKHQEIKDLATGIIAAQTKEIGEMQAWGKTWYNQ